MNDSARETVGVLLQVTVDLAGLLLVFVSFVYSRSESFSSSVRADKYKNVARAGFIPFGFALLCAWLCLLFLQGSNVFSWAVLTFKIVLVVLAWYAFVVIFIYL